MGVESVGFDKASDSIQFFFFLAILFIYPKWDDAIFIQDHEIITHNLHVIPTAIDAFLALFSSFCQSADPKIIASGVLFYFSVLQRIVNIKKQKEELKLKSAISFIILADLFPKYVKSIEYGRISQSFPNSIVSEAYREIELHGIKVPIEVHVRGEKIDPSKKGKKDKKAKK